MAIHTDPTESAQVGVFEHNKPALQNQLSNYSFVG